MKNIFAQFITSIVPLALFNSIFVILVFIFLRKYRRGEIPVDMEIYERGESPFIGMWMRQWWAWVINPVVKFFVNKKIHPDKITIFSFILSIFSAIFYYFGLIALGGWFTLLYGTMDIIDGKIARATGKTSKRGAFLDSVLDRYSELLTYFAILLYVRDTYLIYFVLLLILGSTLVSYTRARGESLGIEIKIGSMQRPERIVYLGITSALSPLLTYALSFYMKNPPEILFNFGVILIGVFSNFSAIQRLLFGYRELGKTL